MTDEAVKQIRKQVSSPATFGFVWIGSWNSRFAPHLGPLRAFIEGRAEDFIVIPGDGKKYTVELAPAHGSVDGSWDAKYRQSWRSRHAYMRPRRGSQRQQHGPVQMAPKWVPKRAIGGA